MARIRTCCQNYGLRYFLVVLWLAINGLVFYKTFSHYQYAPEYYYLHQMLGVCLCISRSTANVINLNLGALILPMCRCLLVALRKHLYKVSPATTRALLDHSKGFHIMCAYLVLIASVGHLVGHLFNIAYFSQNYSTILPELNAARYKNENPVWIVFRSVPGITGILLVLLLSLMVSSSIYAVRRKEYNIFWWIHRIHIIFYLIILIHGAKGILKKQSNINHHTPGCLFLNMSLSDKLSQEAMAEPEYSPQLKDKQMILICDEQPRFEKIGCSTWLWVSFPLLLYCCDTFYRLIKRQGVETSLDDIKYYHNADVLELTICKQDFHCKPGQFIMVQFPAVSVWEWHPYTVTKCPEGHDWFAIHMKINGDWAERVKSLLSESSIYPPVLVDGPLGGGLQEIVKFSTSICIAGGIGITPFIAVLHDLKESQCQSYHLERLHLVWINRDSSGLDPFIQDIININQQFWDMNRPDLLNIQLFITRQSQISGLTLQQNQFIEPIVTFDRPDWKSVLSDIITLTSRESIGVFTCGPSSLIKDVEKHAMKIRTRAQINLFHESF